MHTDITKSTNDINNLRFARLCIENDELNKAWEYINKITSTSLKDNIFKEINLTSNNIKERIQYDTFYQGCDGNIHSRSDGDGGSSSSGGDGGGCCAGVALLISSICCSISIQDCCFCAIWDLFIKIAKCCN